jgi:ring-1,2-phenylacetyl-CoA epoxidase subunit PaaD
MATETLPTLDDVWAMLAEVPDPEIPNLSLLDLGVIRGVELADDGGAVVKMSPTYTGCPATDMMKLLIHERLVAGGCRAVTVDVVLSPAWSTDEITERGREKLREAGIAPPVGRSTDKRHLLGETPDVACPHCGAADTRMLSPFGSTACKALFQCNACLEPFDYFKCH